MEAHEGERAAFLPIGKLWNSLNRLSAARGSIAPGSAPILRLSTISKPGKGKGRENRAIKNQQKESEYAKGDSLE